MARVPITLMGFRCDRCGHEWLPRDANIEPAVCPKCKSRDWNRPPRSMMTYENFSAKVRATIKTAGLDGLTWTEIRTQAGLAQLFPNNQWVHRMERDIGLIRNRDAHGIIHWKLAEQ
jgi:hypothetical protein